METLHTFLPKYWDKIRTLEGFEIQTHLMTPGSFQFVPKLSTDNNEENMAK